ncbi:hypothetical protein Tco_0567940 [Tanacetum coccineum]
MCSRFHSQVAYGTEDGWDADSSQRNNFVPSKPSRPTFGEDEIRSLVRDALGHLPSDSPLARDSMFEDNVGNFSQSSHRGVEDENVGESSKNSQPSRPTFGEDEIRNLVRDALGQIPSDSRGVGDSMFEDNVGESSQSSHRRVEDENVGESSKTSDNSATYKKLLEECDKELYPGCKYSNLSFTLHLYHVKCIGGVSNKTFGMFLELIRDVFPHLTSLPSSVSEAKKLTKDLGLGYEKIDACPNDCMKPYDLKQVHLSQLCIRLRLPQHLLWTSKMKLMRNYEIDVRRFDFPRSKDVDDVVFSHLRDKFRTLKHRIKKSLLALAAKRLHEANNFDGEMQYTDDEILQALDLVEAPHYFVDHQWESYKDHLRAPKTKQLSAHGKKAREMEHVTKLGSYLDDRSKVLASKAKAGFANKLFEVGISERDDPEKRLEIAREVMQELRAYLSKMGRLMATGVGVTKIISNTKFRFDLRRMRRQGVSSENRFLLNKVAEQSKQIEKQSRKMNMMEENMTKFIGELKTMLVICLSTVTSKDTGL